MSHTSQRRGLSPDRPGEELIVLAMVQGKAKSKAGVAEAMSELAEKMLARGPQNWLSRTFPDLDVPQLGWKQPLLRWLHGRRPAETEAMLFRAVAEQSSVLTALYTDPEKVVALLHDLQGDWLDRNRKLGLPISIVLSGLFHDTHECCQKAGLTEHTYLHSLGFHGRADRLPGPTELELVTMCGHGLVSINRVKDLADQIRRREITPDQAAEEMAKPCICGIVNRERAARVFQKLAEG